MTLRLILAVTAVALPGAVAWLVLERCWPKTPQRNYDRLLMLFLLGPLGAWSASLFFFVWAVAFTPAGRTMVLVHAGLMFASAVVLTLMRPRRGKSLPLPLGDDFLFVESRESRSLARLLGLLTCLPVVLLGLGAFASRLLQNPHGLWDAWAIWNLRARFLFRSGLHWTDSFSPDLFWSSPGYPPGLPDFVALAWKYVGSETVMVPMLVASMFFVATGGVLYASLHRQSGRIAAMMGLVALVGTPLFVRHSAAQYADVPVGFFFLTSIALMASYDSDPDKRRGWLILVGVAASLAAWTKNEGLLFLFALSATRVSLAASRSEWRQLGREASGFAAGAAPTLVILAAFKILLAPSASLFAAQSWGTIVEKLGDWSRYREVSVAFFKQMSMFGDGMAPLTLATAVLVGVNWRELRRKRWLSGVLVLGLMLIGYFFVYIITPERLTWYMGVSLSRILLQLWPMTIFLIYSNIMTAKAVQSG